jgi:hypothetical protein
VGVVRVSGRERAVPVETPERKLFRELADRLSRSPDPEEQRHLKEELAHMTFGN